MLINNDNKIKETARILYDLHPQKLTEIKIKKSLSLPRKNDRTGIHIDRI